VRTRLTLAALVALVVTLASSCTTVRVEPDAPAPAPAPPPKASAFSKDLVAWRLVLVHLSDTEAGLLPEEGSKVGGLARMQAVTAALKNRAGTDAIVVGAGDLFIPSPELSLELDGKSAVLAGNNQLFLDASAVGNHELDLGEQFLADAIAQASFPYLSATLHVKGGPLAKVVVDVPTAEGAATPWASDVKGKLVPRAKVCAAPMIFGGADGGPRCDGLVVGLVGATTEELRLISSGASSNLAVPNDLAGVRDDVQAQVDALRREGIEVIVLLSHLQGAFREAQLVKSGLHGVDVVIAGGGENRLASRKHRLAEADTPDRLCKDDAFGQPCYPTTLVADDGKPVLLVATGGDMRYVGNLITNYDIKGVLTGYNQEASRPWPVDEDSLLELRAVVDKPTLAFQQRVHEELAPLLEVVAPSSVYLEGAREEVRNRETNFGDLSADAIQAAAASSGAVLALRNGGGIRGPIGALDDKTGAKKGAPIRLLDLKTALRFDSTIVVVDTTHAGLARTLESALRGAGTSKGHFPQVSSEVHLEYTTALPEQTHVLDGGRIRSLGCPGARVRNLVVTPPGKPPIVVVKDGKVQTPDAPIKLATLEYLAKGGDGWFPGETPAYVPVDGATEQSTLRAFVTGASTKARWQGGAGYVDGPATRIVPLTDVGAAELPAGCSR
jgi:5'-nucleotidase